MGVGVVHVWRKPKGGHDIKKFTMSSQLYERKIPVFNEISVMAILFPIAS
jgi:hypothetical protein